MEARKFLVIPWHIWRMEMPISHRVILSEIVQLHSNGSCYASARHFADLCGLSISAVRKVTAALVDKGLVAREWTGEQQRVLVPLLDMPPVTESPAPCPSEGTPPTPRRVHNSTENKQPNKAKNKKRPSLDEVIEAFAAMGREDIAADFFDYYEANGWVQGAGKKPIQNWKAAARGWIRRQPQYNAKQKGYKPANYDRNTLENWANKTPNK